MATDSEFDYEWLEHLVSNPSNCSIAEAFSIAQDIPVLVVEDMDKRIAWFRKRLPHAVFATTADAAILELQNQTFAAVFLDHDLSFLDAADPNRLHGNGKEVARYLACHEYPGLVVIHSRNLPAAEKMHAILPLAHRVPFGTFEIFCEPAPPISHDEQ